MALLDQSGIYAIEHIKDGSVYVGATKFPFLRRWHQHRGMLGIGHHPSRGLQRDWTLAGEGWFKFVVLEQREWCQAFAHREQHWIDTLRLEGRRLYNRAPAWEYRPYILIHSETPRPLNVTRWWQPPKPVSLTTAAEYLGVSYQTMIRWVQEGLLQAEKVGSRWQVNREHLEHFHVERMTPSSSPDMA